MSSRFGVEAKPTWQSVPKAVRDRVEAELGQRVTRGARVWGGYGPTPTFRLKLVDGSGVFLKGTNRESNEFSRAALDREIRNYRELSDQIAPWAPAVRGTFRLDDWQVLLLDDLGPKSVPPWTPTTARAVARGMAEFHRASLGAELPAFLRRPEFYLGRLTWERVSATSDDLRFVAELAGHRSDEALAWLRRAYPILAEAAAALPDAPGPFALLHGDIRSDNLRLREGRPVFFDWPHAVVGAPEYDLVEFAQTVTVEGGPEPELVVAEYARHLEVRGPVLDASIAWLAAFFADTAWRPEIPGLPRLRRFQAQQLWVLLDWAARRFGLTPRVSAAP